MRRDQTGLVLRVIAPQLASAFLDNTLAQYVYSVTAACSATPRYSRYRLKKWRRLKSHIHVGVVAEAAYFGF
jgi:hypothetical protein